MYVLPWFDNRNTKLKIATGACTIGCSGEKNTDIGIIATRDGFELFVGGTGGPFPEIGRRVERKASEDRVMEVVETLVEFHDRKTEKNSVCISCSMIRNFLFRKYKGVYKHLFPKDIAGDLL